MKKRPKKPPQKVVKTDPKSTTSGRKNTLPYPHLLRVNKSASAYGMRVGLSHILPRVERKPGQTYDEVVLTSYRELLPRWRKRAWSLAMGGFSLLHGGARRNRLLLCPPTGVTTLERLRPCKVATVCPFCWVRQHIGDTYNRIERAVYDRPDIPRSKWQLVTARIDYRAGSGITLQEIFAHIVAERSRFLEAEFSNASGAFNLFVVEPRDPRADFTWKLSQRIVALTRSTNDIPETNHDEIWQKVTVKSYGEPNRKKIAIACGEAAVYPASMLYGPVGDMVEILEARRIFGGARLRCSANYGSFRAAYGTRSHSAE